jgi:hypothetical protein
MFRGRYERTTVGESLTVFTFSALTLTFWAIVINACMGA